DDGAKWKASPGSERLVTDGSGTCLIHVFEGRDFQCLRQNRIERKRWSKHHQSFSRAAAGYESPARKCRVKWNKYASPVGTSRVFTHTLSVAPRKTRNEAG